jgi:hypothetical protein
MKTLLAVLCVLCFALARGRARVRAHLMTITLASNDVVALVTDCQGDFACVQQRAPAEIAKLSARLATVLVALRIAEPAARIVVTGPYDPNRDPFAHALYASLDSAMRTVTTRLTARYVPLIDEDLCSLTVVCTSGDAHPSDAGHRRIADLIL